jgi:uncharacterized membrane protein
MEKRHSYSFLPQTIPGLLWLIFLLFNSSCTYDKATEAIPQVPETPEEIVVSYKEDIQPIIEAHCYSCHSATATHPEKPGYAFLDSYDGLKKYALKTSTSNASMTTLQARLRFIEFPGMPFKEEPLPESEIQKIEAWIKQGAPDN